MYKNIFTKNQQGHARVHRTTLPNLAAVKLPCQFSNARATQDNSHVPSHLHVSIMIISQNRPHNNNKNLTSDCQIKCKECHANTPISNLMMTFWMRQYWILFINNYAYLIA